MGKPKAEKARERLNPSSRSWLQRFVRPDRVHVEISALKESAEKRRRFIRDTDDLIRCLTIELEIELGLGSTVVPVEKTFELASSQASLRERGASDDNAHARSLPGDSRFPWDRFGRGDHATRDETWAAFVFARENEYPIVFGNVLATVHRLVRRERERLCLWIANLSFDREHHTSHLAQLIPCRS